MDGKCITKKVRGEVQLEPQQQVLEEVEGLQPGALNVGMYQGLPLLEKKDKCLNDTGLLTCQRELWA